MIDKSIFIDIYTQTMLAPLSSFERISRDI
jgi:hypothetical protein